MARKLTKTEKRWVQDQILPGLRDANPEADSVEVVVLDDCDEQGCARYYTVTMSPIETRRLG